MKKVLVVDDTKNIRLMLTTCLEIRGYEVIVAENGQSALDIIEKEGNNIHIIFLDIRMPGMNGTDVLRGIRNMNIDCQVIIMTAFATIKNAVDCTRLGAVAYLQKPFSPERVNALLDEIEGANTDDVSSEIHKEPDNIHILKAENLIMTGDLEQAFNELKLALSINPYEKKSYYLIGKINELSNNLKEAKRFYSIYELFKD